MAAVAQRSKAKATSARILAAAEALFLSRSYADVTMDMIASAAEVTKGGLYHHFESKEQLYLTLLHEDLDAKRDLFGRTAAAPGSARERLTRLTRDFLELPASKRRLMRLVRRDANTFGGDEREELVRAYQSALPEQVETILRDGIREGELAPAEPRVLAWSFVALVEVALASHAERALGGADEQLQHVLNLFLRGAAAASPGESQ